MNGTCRYCLKPRPIGYAITCGRSECQEQDYRNTMARVRGAKKVRREKGKRT